jgi:glycosyltransferase involved in cell wall biosynthesis
VGLPAWRRRAGRRGVTLNLVFYLAAAAHLHRHAQPGDWLVTASFAKLLAFLLARRAVRRRCRAIYEVHQLALLDDGGLSAAAAREIRILAQADQLITTTTPLRRALAAHLPGHALATVGLACGFNPAEQPPVRLRRTDEPFTLGYLGSLYASQGVDWLIEHWPALCGAVAPTALALEIIGGTPADHDRLRARVSALGLAHVAVHAARPAAQLREQLAPLDALIIPALPVGRMPHVAITKAYDYLGLNRPVLAADLPSITEVIPETAGYFFRAGDAASLAAALRRLVCDPIEASHRAAAAAERAARLTWSARAAEWWHVAGETPLN